MIKSFLMPLTFCLVLFTGSTQGEASSKTKVSIYSETFGNQKNPAILLNAGAGNQSITWPVKFCETLANKGYFVIRYDYRDTGLSSGTDHEKNPYNVLDLAKDAVNVLKRYGLTTAHFVGFSMGGQLAQLAGAYLPEHVQSITLLGTSTDFRPGFNAFVGNYTDEGLSTPHPDYVEYVNTYTQSLDHKSLTLQDKINSYVGIWKRLDGNVDNFDEAFYREQGRIFHTRSNFPEPCLAHFKAMQNSYDLHEKAPALIKAPTLIIQGTKDPVFPPDHGQDLHAKIQNSQLIIWDGFAHAISPQNFERIITAIDQFIKKGSVTKKSA